jgi:hypothetical protein
VLQQPTCVNDGLLGSEDLSSVKKISFFYSCLKLLLISDQISNVTLKNFLSRIKHTLIWKTMRGIAVAHAFSPSQPRRGRRAVERSKLRVGLSVADRGKADLLTLTAAGS